MLSLDTLGGVLGVVPFGRAAAVSLAVVGEPIAPATVLVFVGRNLCSVAGSVLEAQDLGGRYAVGALTNPECSELATLDLGEHRLPVALPAGAQLGDGKDCR